MKDQNDSNKIVNNVVGLLNTYLQLFKLEIKEELSKTTKNVTKKFGQIITKLIVTLVIGLASALFGFILVFFLTLGVAKWINEMMSSTFSGYLLVALFYFISILIMILLREKIIKQISLKFNNIPVKNTDNNNKSKIDESREGKAIERSQEI